MEKARSTILVRVLEMEKAWMLLVEERKRRDVLVAVRIAGL